MTPSASVATSSDSYKRQMTECQLFEKVVSLIRGDSDEENDVVAMDGGAAADDILTNEDKLRFYGLYKRVTVGRLKCNDYDNEGDDGYEDDERYGGECNVHRPDPPSRFSIVAWYKYNAWLQCDELTKSQARMEYVKLASKEEYSCHPVGRECRRIFENYCKGIEEEREKGINGNNLVCEKEANIHSMKDDTISKTVLNSDKETNHSINNSHDESKPTIALKNDGNTATTSPHSLKKTKDPTINLPPRKLSTMEKYFGQYLNIQPLLPRGQIDISYKDLMFAWNQCCLNCIPALLPLGSMSPISQFNQYEKKIANVWCSKFSPSTNRVSKDSLPSFQHDEIMMKKENIVREEVVVGLSVRSLLDLYLTAKSYSARSEIIIVPAINIQTMVDVMLYHGLLVVPVDILPQKDNQEKGLATGMVDVKAVEQSITKHTVAIMVVHPFGQIAAPENDMEKLSEIASKHNLDLIEDCAECYAGDGGVHGSIHSDIKFFSFGTIKTSTSLGGGLAILPIKNESVDTKQKGTMDVVDRMRRIHCSNLYRQQTALEYMKKVLMCALIRWVSDHPLICGSVYTTIEYFGWTYDDIVTSAIRGFSSHVSNSSNIPSTKRNTANFNDEELRRRYLLSQIRKRPSVALLALLHRRLMQSEDTSRKIRERIQRCQYAAEMIKKYATAVAIPCSADAKQRRGVNWLFPISLSNPQIVSNHLLAKGYDIPRGTSQLGCVTSFLKSTAECDSENEWCPNTQHLMNSLLYLPVASRHMSKDDILRMVHALQDTTTTDSTTLRWPKKTDFEHHMRNHRSYSLSLTMMLVSVTVIVLFDGFVLQYIPNLLVFLRIIFHSMVAMIPYFAIILSTLFVLVHFLRTKIGLLYIDSSKTFAKYNPMLHNNGGEFSTGHFQGTSKELICDNKQEKGLKTSGYNEKLHTQSSSLFDMDALRLPIPERNCVEKPAVLLTGATGFIGSLLLRYLLLHRRDLSIDGGVVIICRSKRGSSASDRINKLLSTKMFSFLSDKEKQSPLVTVIEGDVTCPDVGLSAENLENICKVMNITHVFHCAASVSFTQSLDAAAMSNITSSLQLQALTRKMKIKDAKFVHVSTAFVHGNFTGTDVSPLPEDLFPLYPYDPEELYRSMVETQSYASLAMQKLGFPNTYTFSKCICEHLLIRNDAVNTIIIRPSIVGPAVSEPYEGWAGQSPSTVVAAACLYLMYQYNIWCFGRERVPFIPVDVVCRFILSKAFTMASSENALTNSDNLNSIGGKPFGSEPQPPEDKVTGDQKITECYSSMNGNLGHSIEVSPMKNKIFTAAWDASSPSTSAFLWLDYAFAVTHLGAVKGYFTRSVAYVGLLVTVHIFPYFKMDKDAFKMLHKLIVLLPLNALQMMCNFVGWKPRFLSELEKLIPFLDLPLLFYPYVNATFHFKSDLKAPGDFNGERYMFSCAVAAECFVSGMSYKQGKEGQRAENPTKSSKTGREALRALPSTEPSHTIVAGKNHVPLTSDVWWALTQPRGNYTIRLVGWFLLKLFSRVMTEVTVDMPSFALLAQKKEMDQTNPSQRSHVILVPTHRSFFDFLLLSFVCFALPEIDLDIPYIAAADEFSHIPILGFIAKAAQAFFLKRGNGKVDPYLSAKLIELKQDMNPATIEVFIEGKRSRDRRFIKPKTGFLRCLVETGGDHLLLPICISYESIPEQSTLSKEADGASRDCLRLGSGLLLWLKSVYLGKINIGRVHIAASEPVLLTSSSQTNFAQLGQILQKRQQEKLLVSSFHINAGANVLGLPTETIKAALVSTGCNFWSEKSIESPPLPHSLSEQWTIMLQYAHFFAPFFVQSHPHWCEWLNPGAYKGMVYPEGPINKDVSAVILALSRHFIAAEELVEDTMQLLNLKGFSSPQSGHILQHLSETEPSTPLFLLKAVTCMKQGKCKYTSPCTTPPTTPAQNDFTHRHHIKNISNAGPVQALFHPSTSMVTTGKDANDKSQDNESFGAWGYNDSGFIVEIDKKGAKCVKMKGNRYHISGKSLPRLVSFLEEVTKIKINPERAAFPVIADIPSVPKSDLNASDLAKLSKIVRNEKQRISTSAIDRARHGTGHSQADMFMIRSGSLEKIRLPDAVLWPADETEVEALVNLSVIEDWCLIPFGGGTNVSHSTRCPPKHIEPRPIISVDIKLMDNILWVNEEDGVAHVQAGITGKSLADEMELRGYTIGHEPDSIEFSTLGGWIATKASGMKRNKYGNIEDIVRDIRVVGPKGIIWQQKGIEKSVHGRVSTGIDFLSVMLGSEGGLGIITSAIIKIWPTPECKEYQSVILPCFEDGLRFVRDVAKMNNFKPASIRLLDNEQFRLGKAMTTGSTGLNWLQNAMTTFIDTMFSTISIHSAVCATISFEGSRSEIKFQKQSITNIAAKHGGFFAGSRVGKAGYDLTFAIAYLRDFAMTYHFLAESFETFVPWSRLAALVKATKECIRQEHKARLLPGLPFISCRVTQLYDEGACVYFYFCMNFENVSEPSSVFAEIEAAARKEILANGGSLSHHHGVGKLRAAFMNEVNSKGLKDMMLTLKKSFDEKNTFGARNGVFSSCS